MLLIGPLILALVERPTGQQTRHLAPGQEEEESQRPVIGQQTRGVVAAGVPTLRTLGGNPAAMFLRECGVPYVLSTACSLHWQYEYEYMHVAINDSWSLVRSVLPNTKKKKA